MLELCLTSPFRFRTLAGLDLCPGPCRSQIYPLQGSLPSSIVSINLTSTPPLPCWPRLAADSSVGPGWWHRLLLTL